MPTIRISLRYKIFCSVVGIFILFFAFLYPLVPIVVKRIIIRSIHERSGELIKKIQDEKDDEQLIQKLKDQKYLIFFRVSLITNERKLLYDSYTKRLLGPGFNKKKALNHPEVEQAFVEGFGFHEGYSTVLRQHFIYMAKSFDFQGKTYILRTAYPSKVVDALSADVKLGLILLSLFATTIFGSITWFLLHWLTRPIRHMIAAIRPYHEGKVEHLPKLVFPSLHRGDEASQLASTLNSLSKKVQHQIDKLIQERNEKRAILESLVEGVIAVDKQMRVTYANRISYKLLGVTSEPFSSRELTTAELSSRDLLLKCQQEQAAVTSVVHVDSPQRIFEMTAVPKGNDGGAVLVIEDKTVHYKLIEMRKDFIANASHELKTPITVIRGFAETLQNHPHLPSETYQAITQKMINSSKRMAMLIKDLLTLTDIEHSKEDGQMECDLPTLLQNCQSFLMEKHPDAQVTIDQPAEEVVTMGHHNLLELAFMNLLENAAKYSVGPAQIRVKLIKREQGVDISIADQGIGIPEGELENIFHRFYTVNKAHSRKLGGSGLGLSIVETIIKKHQGTISVASQLNKGSTFTIHLPG